MGHIFTKCYYHICDRSLIGKSTNQVRNHTRHVRVVERSGEVLPIHRDFEPKRCNVKVNRGIITSIDGYY